MELNQDTKEQQLNSLKIIYYEILDGASLDGEVGFYIKHFSELDNHLLLQQRLRLVDFYTKEGIPTDSELLKNAIQNGDWTQEKEDKILFFKQNIIDNEKHLLNIIIQQRASIELRMKEVRKELSAILIERQQILGRGLEDLVEEDINDYIGYLSFYNDKECLKPITDSYENYQNQEEGQLVKLNNILTKHCKRINDESIQAIACMPFFLNKFSYCKDSIYNFLGKPLADLTYHQNYLFSLGCRNLAVASHSKGSPPDLTLCSSTDDLVKWYNREHSLMISKPQKV